MIKELQTGPLDHVHLQWFAEGDDPGQVVNGPVIDGQAGNVEPEPFFSVSIPGENGQEEVLKFQNQEEVARAFKEHALRRSDYSKKTAEVAQMRKAVDADKQLYAQMLADYNKRKADLDKQAERYSTYEEKLRLNPALRKQLEQTLNQPHSGEDIQSIIKDVIEAQYGPTIQEMSDWKREKQLEEEKRLAYDACKQEFEDFDPAAVDSVYQELASGDIKSLVRALYFAHKGKNINPEQMKQAVVEGIKKKQGAGLPSTDGSSASLPKGKTPGSMEEALEALDLE